jgi:hypothetical protein
MAVGDAMVSAWESEGVSSHRAVLALQHRGSTWTALPDQARVSGRP